MWPGGGGVAALMLPPDARPHPAAALTDKTSVRLPRIGLQSGRLDAGDRADFVIVGGVTGDADRP